MPVSGPLGISSFESVPCRFRDNRRHSVATTVHVDSDYAKELHWEFQCKFFVHSWVKYTGAHHTAETIVAGRDHDGIDLIVGRAMHNGDLLPAKVKLEQGIAYVPHNGEEHVKRDFEILISADCKWITSRDGGVPPGALQCGWTSDGETLYAGRTDHDGVTCIGKVHPSHGVMYIPYGGQEIATREYQVLG